MWTVQQLDAFLVHCLFAFVAAAPSGRVTNGHYKSDGFFRKGYSNGLLDNVYVLCALCSRFPDLVLTYTFLFGLLQLIRPPKTSSYFLTTKYTACFSFLGSSRTTPDLYIPSALNELDELSNSAVQEYRKIVKKPGSRRVNERLAALNCLQINSGILAFALATSADAMRWYEECSNRFGGLTQRIPFAFCAQDKLTKETRELIFILTHIFFVCSDYGTKPLPGWFGESLPAVLTSWCLEFNSPHVVDANLEECSELAFASAIYDQQGAMLTTADLSARLSGPHRPRACPGNRQDLYTFLHTTACCGNYLASW